MVETTVVQFIGWSLGVFLVGLGFGGLFGAVYSKR